MFPSGNDSNAGTQAAPFATLHRAQAAVRGHLAAGTKDDITVFLREGVYYLENPLTFPAADAGT